MKKEEQKIDREKKGGSRERGREKMRRSEE